MSLKIVTDFRDYYDHAFGSSGDIFVRMASGGMTRREMFPFLAKAGFLLPKNGLVRHVCPDLVSSWEEDLRETAMDLLNVVVYLDESAHQGEGKIKVSLAEALLLYPGHYCTEYISAVDDGRSRSFRYLQVGNRHWWVERMREHSPC